MNKYHIKYKRKSTKDLLFERMESVGGIIDNNNKVNMKGER